jgi:4-hydroxy-tetrahydrodipicolinate reductase
MTLSICVAGATGWTGRPVAEAVLAAPGLSLVSAVSRSSAGRDLGQAWGGETNGVPVFGSVAEALDGVDVLIDYTSHAAVRDNTLTAVTRGVSVVVGSSGLGADDYADIDAAARESGVGVVAAGNFSLTAALAQAAVLLAARHLPSWEIIDYASASKPDAPSGTARELAERLAEIKTPAVEIPIAQTAGHPDARGATIAGNQVHSVRVPGFVISVEAVFGLPGERLTIRHDAGSSAEPYVAGTLLAARRATDCTGLTRGLDRLLLGSE